MPVKTQEEKKAEQQMNVALIAYTMFRLPGGMHGTDVSDWIGPLKVLETPGGHLLIPQH